MARHIEAMIIEFPKEAARDAASRRPLAPLAGAATATVLILPSIRIERHDEAGPHGSDQGAGRRKRRRRAHS